MNLLFGIALVLLVAFSGFLIFLICIGAGSKDEDKQEDLE